MPTLLQIFQAFLAAHPLDVVPGEFDNPTELPRRIGPNDPQQLKDLKLDFNARLFGQKVSYNAALGRGAREGFLLLFDILTGIRPPGWPNHLAAVLALDRDDWHALGSQTRQWAHWEERNYSVGRCRTEYCIFHGVIVILTLQMMLVEDLP